MAGPKRFSGGASSTNDTVPTKASVAAAPCVSVRECARLSNASTRRRHPRAHRYRPSSTHPDRSRVGSTHEACVHVPNGQLHRARYYAALPPTADCHQGASPNIRSSRVRSHPNRRTPCPCRGTALAGSGTRWSCSLHRSNPCRPRLRVLIGSDRQELRQPSGLFIVQADRAHRTIHDPDRQSDMLVMEVHGALRRDELMLLSIAARTKHGVGLLASGIRESHEELGHLGCRGVRDPARRQSRAAGGTEAVYGLLRRCTRRTVHQVIVLRVVRQRNVENA